MPGSSHDVDPSFMDNLPLPLRDPALDFIRYSGLKELLTMRLEGPSQFLKEQYPALTADQWNKILDAVILTKVSYFELEVKFPNRYIDKLIEIIAFAYNMKSEGITELYQALINDHPQMAAWIKKALLIKQQNIKLANSQT
jgi:hypothetical protein